MPHIFKMGGYTIYFWSNENLPPEPVHVHVSKGNPKANGTKIWITSAQKCLLANNKSKIPGNILANIMDVIEARAEEIIAEWEKYFGEVRFYC